MKAAIEQLKLRGVSDDTVQSSNEDEDSSCSANYTSATDDDDDDESDGGGGYKKVVPAAAEASSGGRSVKAQSHHARTPAHLPLSSSGASSAVFKSATNAQNHGQNKACTVVTHRLGRCFADTSTHFSH